jgi:L-amino acid N-acyltransferase YncA
MIVRRATPQDAQGIVSILQAIVDKGGTTAFQGEVPADFLVSVLDGSTPRGVCHVAEQDGELLGFQYIFPLKDGPEDRATIATFARLGSTQRGIGAALFGATREAAIRFGYRDIDATIRADNTGGLRYYGRMGFVDHHVTPGVPLSDGTPVDRVTKLLDLRGAA